MVTEEAEGRLNLFNDPSPLPNTKNIDLSMSYFLYI